MVPVDRQSEIERSTSMNATRGTGVSIPQLEKAIDSKHVTIPMVVPETTPSRMLTPKFAEDDVKLPKIPVPSGPLDLPPQTSDYVQVAVNPTQKLLLEWASGGFFDPKDLIIGVLSPAVPDYTLVYRLYWNQAAYQQASGPQDFIYTADVTEGMSTTDSTTISGEFGVDVKGISAKLSVAFQHSITISEEHKVSHQYRIKIPEGKIGVWTLWQLVQEIIAVDSSGKQVQYSGEVDLAFFQKPCSLPATLVTQSAQRYAAEMALFDE